MPSRRAKRFRSIRAFLSRKGGVGPAGLFAVVALAIVVVVARTFSVSCAADRYCVSVDDLAEGADIPEAIHLMDRHGQPLADVDGPRRRALVQADVPPKLASAFVAVEDERYWDHGGIDLMGVARAAVKNVTSGGRAQGASTIPMQLVRTVWADQFRDVNPWRRKVIEARLAPRLVGELGRERVLTLYVNAIYMGHGLWGVNEAARYYFGTTPDKLSNAQIATLVGMTRGPEIYEPRRHPERSKSRRDVVLGKLAEQGVITDAEAAAARLEPLGTVDTPERIAGRSYVSEAVLREVAAVAPALAGRPGLRVVTTVDPAAQDAAEAAIDRQLEAIEGGRYGTYTEGTDGPVQVAAVALDHHSGEVRAWVGGRDFGRSMFDRVVLARRQVGSLVKPFVVASALEQGRGLLEMVSTRPLEGSWSPRDHVDQAALPIREALVQSSNRATVRIGQSLSSHTLPAVGRKVGLSGDIPDVPSAFIGAFEASLLEMTRAYAAFANGGLLVQPHLVDRIEDAGGTVLWQHTATSGERVLDPVTSYAVLDAMTDVVDRGTGWRIRQAGYGGAAAGKTGTTNDGNDAWFVGVTPDLAAGIWVGFDTPRTVVSGGAGGTLAAPAWGDWMRHAGPSLTGSGGFPAPEGGMQVRYDPWSGEAHPRGCWTAYGEGWVEAWVASADRSVTACPSAPRVEDDSGGWLSGIFDKVFGRDHKKDRKKEKPNRGRGRGRGRGN